MIRYLQQHTTPNGYITKVRFAIFVRTGRCDHVYVLHPPAAVVCPRVLLIFVEKQAIGVACVQAHPTTSSSSRGMVVSHYSAERAAYHGRPSGGDKNGNVGYPTCGHTHMHKSMP